MTKEEYQQRVAQALNEFWTEIVPEFEFPVTGGQLEELNDELMLAVYEHTMDTRKA